MQVIIGFFIILAHLVTGIVKDHQIRTVATFLTDNMTMFFLPAFMGIMDLWGIIRMNIVAWVIVVVVSTLMVLLSTAYTQDGIESLLSKSRGKKS